MGGLQTESPNMLDRTYADITDFIAEPERSRHFGVQCHHPHGFDFFPSKRPSRRKVMPLINFDNTMCFWRPKIIAPRSRSLVSVGSRINDNWLAAQNQLEREQGRMAVSCTQEAHWLT